MVAHPHRPSRWRNVLDSARADGKVVAVGDGEHPQGDPQVSFRDAVGIDSERVERQFETVDSHANLLVDAHAAPNEGTPLLAAPWRASSKTVREGLAGRPPELMGGALRPEPQGQRA